MEEKKLAMEWWESMSVEEMEQTERKFGYYGHDIGTTEEDVVSMYRMHLNRLN